MNIDRQITFTDLTASTASVFEIASQKVRAIESSWDPADGSPVYTVQGRYAARGWTEWTQGFQYGCAILCFDGAGDDELLQLGRRHTLKRMAPHITHIGVHDHGFNNLSTFGNLRRLAREGRFDAPSSEVQLYELAIKASAAVQAARWTPIDDSLDALAAKLEDAGAAGAAEVDPKRPVLAPPVDDTLADDQAFQVVVRQGDKPTGFVHSFNGPHSLFIDTMRTLRILGLGDRLGHVLMGEHDQKISLLGRAIAHSLTTAHYIVWYGQGRDVYDVRGRTAHEGVFNVKDGRFRCPGTQQGYSPFSTWTRGLAWAMLGFAEQLEFVRSLPDADVALACGLSKPRVSRILEHAARATCDHYIDDCTALDGVCYWDAGAPGLLRMSDWRHKPAQPINDHEPVDASASAIAAQGLLRLGATLQGEDAARYTQAGLTVAQTLLAPPYLSNDAGRQGLLLHSIYHRPNGWDYIPEGHNIPSGEASMWGDYHLLELALYIKRQAQGGPYLAFFDQ